MFDYYSLYFGEQKDGRFSIVSSEKIPLPNLKWRLMNNGELLSF
jgi:hypothetical protein